MTDGARRRRGPAPGQASGPRAAVHRQVRLGSAELVPDLDRADSWLLFIDGVPQSGVDLADPGYLEFEYIRRIAHAVDHAFPPGEPVRALHLGGGALTLPRYLAHARPGSRQLVAEIDDQLTSLIREHLPLPAGHRIRVRGADARAVTESVPPGSYDLVVADVYAGAVTPPHLTTAEFTAATARALRPGGVYAVNVAAGPGMDSARSAVATVRSAYKETAMIAEASVLRGRRRGNLVILGSDQPLPEAALARAAAGDPFPARLVTGEDLVRFTAGAPVLRDPVLRDPVITDVTVSDDAVITDANSTASTETSPQPTAW